MSLQLKGECLPSQPSPGWCNKSVMMHRPSCPSLSSQRCYDAGAIVAVAHTPSRLSRGGSLSLGRKRDESRKADGGQNRGFGEIGV